MNNSKRLRNRGDRSRKWKPTSIRTKLLLVVLIATSITASLMTAMQIRTICRDVFAEAQAYAAALSMPVKHALNNMLANKPRQAKFQDLARTDLKLQIRKVLREILNSPGRQDIIVAYVVDRNGKIVVGEEKAGFTSGVPGDVFESEIKGLTTPRMVNNDGRYDTFVPYYHSPGQLAGYITIGIPAESLSDRATSLKAGIIISYAIILITTVSVLALWVSRYLVKPLEKITLSIARGAESGETGLGKLTKSCDEIGQLARVANEVLPELYKERQELKTSGTLLTTENGKLEQITQALLEVEHRYRSAVEAATGVVYELDLATGKFLFLSRRVHNILGFSAEDLPSSDAWSEHIHKDDRAQAEASLELCLSDQKSCFSRAYRFVCKEGHTLQLVELGKLIRDRAGGPGRISGIIIPEHVLPKAQLAAH